MTIPRGTLEGWANQGAVATPKALREKIERKLTGENSKVQNKYGLEIYLQGSYRNNTNIYGSSDVDIVVQHDSTFFSDVSDLDTFEKSIYNNAFSDSTYTWATFKNEVVETLKEAFGSNKIEIGNKSIKINDGNYEADVIPCFQYRKYVNFGHSENEREYIPGIKFYTTNENRSVVNFPKEHYKNGAAKNQRTTGYFKPTVRVFKNMKKRMIEKDLILKEEVPSYFLENLLYNVPDNLFNEIYLEKRVFNILKWVGDNRHSLSELICQNEQLMLFGYSQEQWNEDDARKFINQVINFWNEWE